jgi:site-specific DNA-cytosine methylase
VLVGPAWPAEVAPTLDASWNDRAPHTMNQEFTSKRGGLFVPGITPDVSNPITANEAKSWGISSDAIDRSGEGADGTAAKRSGLGISVDVQPTLKARPTNSVATGVTRDLVDGVMTQNEVRRLTPRECERLQGFPDDYTLVPHKGKPAADGNRYKSIGNSMACNVMRWIGSRISASDGGAPR